MTEPATLRRFEPADALVAVDIGNSRIGIAVWDDDGVHDTRRVDAREPDQWNAALAAAWEHTRGARRRQVVIGSVWPEQTHRFGLLAERICNVDALRVRDDLPLPMPLAIDNPEGVGVDRVCSAAAAYEHIQGACAVASFGTATTIDCVSADGRFLGGAILPGIAMAFETLHAGTASLPQVAPFAPRGPFGRDTHEAIVNGVLYGAVGALREIVERFANELSEWPQLVLTGGNAPLVAPLADFVDSVVPDLCLMGIALAYRRAAGQK